MSSSKKILIIAAIGLIVLVALGAAYRAGKNNPAPEKRAGQAEENTQDDKGASITLPGEKHYFSENEGLEVTSPKIGEKLKSPLEIKGRAKGGWFFEGSFPVKLLNSQQKVFAEGYVTAEGEWMTENWVNFSGILNFSTPRDAGGYLLLQKDNPSGLPEHDFAVSFPVKFIQEGETGGAAAEAFDENRCGGYPASEPILGDCGEDCNTKSWKIYNNSKYGYSFRYPANYILTNNCKNSRCVSEEDGGDSVVLSGDLSVNGWPLIEIRHLAGEAYNPPALTSTPEWIRNNFSWTTGCLPGEPNIYFSGQDSRLIGAFDIYFPPSYQSYSRREIFFENQGKIFQLVMTDVNMPQSRQFYDIWLSTFQIAE